MYWGAGKTINNNKEKKYFKLNDNTNNSGGLRPPPSRYAYDKDMILPKKCIQYRINIIFNINFIFYNFH